MQTLECSHKKSLRLGAGGLHNTQALAVSFYSYKPCSYEFI